MRGTDGDERGSVQEINTQEEDESEERSDNNNDSSLTEDQWTALTILRNHLEAHLEGDQPLQLCMLLLGEGGTGKSHVLDAVTRAYKHHGISKKFTKTAMTSIAASNIGGTTLHSWAGIPVCRS